MDLWDIAPAFKKRRTTRDLSREILYALSQSDEMCQRDTMSTKQAADCSQLPQRNVIDELKKLEKRRLVRKADNGRWAISDAGATFLSSGSPDVDDA